MTRRPPDASDEQACIRYRLRLFASMQREVLSEVRGVRSSRSDALVPDAFAILLLDRSDPTAGAIANRLYERVGRLAPKCPCGCDGVSMFSLPRESAMAIAAAIGAGDLFTDPLVDRYAVRVLTIAAHGVLSSQVNDNTFSRIVAGGAA